MAFPGGGMQGKRLLRSIRLKNLLSYGSEGETLELEPLNVLIGPNASGKSNLIEAISLLAAAPSDLSRPFLRGGGVSEWIWKGEDELSRSEIEIVLERPLSFRYRLGFAVRRSRLHLLEEVLESEPDSRSKSYSYYSFVEGKASIKIAIPGAKRRFDQILDPEDVGPERSVLSERKGKDVYPELTAVGAALGGFTFFRDCNFGQETVVRLPQRTDLPGDFLLEDASNLALVINHLENNPPVKKLLMEKLRVVYENASDLTTKVDGGTIQILLHEIGLRSPVPATRLSDGTLRYLCLLTILLHPEPPPLICLEEPELGLHPDIIPKVADLLVEASRRTQLIVTTHSEPLVSRLSEVPESVIVCERDDRGTRLQRLDPAKMKIWLERYRLGELWAMGEIGGNRW
jgi:predicted ATPase